MAARFKRKPGEQLHDNIVQWLEEKYRMALTCNGGRTECSVLLGSAKLVFKGCSDRTIGKAIKKVFPLVRRIRSNSTYYYKHLLPKQDHADSDKGKKRTVLSLETVCQLNKNLIYFSECKPIEGISSSVYFATYEKIPVAIKWFKKGTNLENIKKELDALLVLGPHECLPVLLGICVENEPYCIVYKLYGRCRLHVQWSLTTALSMPTPLPTSLWVPFIIKLAESVDHLHKKGHVHGDLNEDHILVYKDENYNFYPKFVGLGNLLRIEDVEPDEHVQDNEMIALGEVLAKIINKFEKRKYPSASQFVKLISDPISIARPSAADIAEKFKNLLDTGYFD